MAFKTDLETREAEAGRLAGAPEGSTTHAYAQLPVNIPVITDGMMIEMPVFADEDPATSTYVVVPVESRRSTSYDPERRPRLRYQREWTCVTVASNNPKVPVGGYRLSIPEHQLVRGTLRTLAAVA